MRGKKHKYSTLSATLLQGSSSSVLFLSLPLLFFSGSHHPGKLFALLQITELGKEEDRCCSGKMWGWLLMQKQTMWKRKGQIFGTASVVEFVWDRPFQEPLSRTGWWRPFCSFTHYLMHQYILSPTIEILLSNHLSKPLIYHLSNTWSRSMEIQQQRPQATSELTIITAKSISSSMKSNNKV